MSVLIIILGIICSLVVTGMIFYLLYLNYRDDDIKEEPVYIENFMPQYTDGHRQGILKNRVYGNRRSIFSFLPLDINYQSRETAEFQHIAVMDARVKVFPKGTWSKNATVIWLLPPTSDELPEIIRSSPEGQVIVKMIEESLTKEEENDIIRNRMEIQSKLLEKTKGFGLVDDYITFDDKFRSDWLKKLASGDKKADNSFIPQPHNTGGI